MLREEAVRAYVLAYVGLADEELRAQILFGDGLVVGKGDGAYASQDQVLGDLVGEGLDRHEEDVCIADPVPLAEAGRVGAVCAPVLGLETPKADLSVVKGDLVWDDQQSDIHGEDGQQKLPAETVSACAMAETSAPAASDAGKVPAAASLPSPLVLPFVAGAIGSAEGACSAIVAKRVARRRPEAEVFVCLFVELDNPSVAIARSPG